MKIFSLIFTLVLANVMLMMSLLQAQDNNSYSSDRLIIKFKTDSPMFNNLVAEIKKSEDENGLLSILDVREDLSIKNFFTEYKIEIIQAINPSVTTESLPGGINRIFILHLNKKEKVEEIKVQLEENSEIEYVEFDYIGYGGGKKALMDIENNFMVPNDPNFSTQWGLRNTGQSFSGSVGIPGIDIRAVDAFDLTTGSDKIKVAVLDTGIPLNHPEFTGRLLQGYDYANNDNNPTDDQGHGTNVSSIIGAKGNNSSLMAGLNWNCKIIPVKVIDQNNFGYYSWWVSGITYAVNNGAKVLNMSVGGNSYSSALYDAATYAYSNGRIIVACMMNENSNVTYYPAGFNNVISIGAINNKGNRAVPFCWGGGSSYGPHIDFCAPGDWILGLDYANQNNVNYWCGTSQATPMVTGTISLMLSLDSNLTFQQIYNILKNTARDRIGPANEDSLGFDSYFGWGLIDLKAALNQLTGIESDANDLPVDFDLFQNYPNPFNPSTKIKFTIPSDIDDLSSSSLRVYDLLGNEVAVLFDQYKSPGSYEIVFSPKPDLASGIYFYELRTGGKTETKKMVLMR